MSDKSLSSAADLQSSPNDAGMSEKLINRLITSGLIVTLLSALLLFLSSAYPVSMWMDLVASAFLIVARLMHRHLSVGQRLFLLIVSGLSIAGAAIVSNAYARDAFLVLCGMPTLRVVEPFNVIKHICA